MSSAVTADPNNDVIPEEGDRPELICAYLLDGKGGATRLGGAEVDAWNRGDGKLWVHLNRSVKGVAAWLRDRLGINALVIEGLLANETRPRCSVHEEGTMLILRGVNLNPGADPEDMVAVRLWIDGDLVVSTRLPRVMAIQDIRDQLATGTGPLSTGHFAARLAMCLTDRMGPVIEDLSDQMSMIEDQVDAHETDNTGGLREIRHPLQELRRVTITLRRYVAPQRDAIVHFSQLETTWLDNRIRARLRETSDAVTRLTEELDEVRERSIIVQDDITNRLSQRMEQTMYLLTIVATIMLPLGLVTGLLGINVGGMPGANWDGAFWVVTAGLGLGAFVEVWLFRKLGWL